MSEVLDPRRPGAYPRRVLLCVAGLSPQVITETLYALAVERPEPERFVPTEVQVVTTAEGARRIQLQLLSRDPGWFQRLRREYRLPPIAFGMEQVSVLERAGEAVDDIRTPEDNECAADRILERVRALTADPACAVHASIAGGRKTMGYYLGYAMSLCGRPQDRLSHVLVEAPYEGLPDFFYPSREERIVFTRDNRPLDASRARIWLAEIPFVSLRHALEARLAEGGMRFGEAVEAARRDLAPPELVLDLEGRRVRAGGVVVELPPAELALYAVFARRALRGEPPLPAPPKGAPDPEWAERFLAEYRLVRGAWDDTEATERALARGMDGDYFSSHKAKLHRALRKALGPAAGPYLVAGRGRPGRFHLRLPPQAVRFQRLEGDGAEAVRREGPH